VADFTYKPDDGSEINLGKYAPGLKSSIQGRWGRHVLPGQQGDLKEDLGDGSLRTTVRLNLITKDDYNAVVPVISRKRRGLLVHPRRGTRQSVITDITEDIEYTERGEVTIVDVVFEDAVVGQASGFRAGPSARSQQVVSLGQTVLGAVLALRERIFRSPDLGLRTLMLSAQDKTTSTVSAATDYANAAQEAFTFGLYGPSVQAQLLALPPQVQDSIVALRLVGPSADTQDTVFGLESMLFAATQLDVAIRAAQPIPITTYVRRQPGQSIWSFVQQHYGTSGKTPADMRNMATLILRLNKQIRNPVLIREGTAVVRPVS
jgi:hypothetical protein